jgi:cytochrome P450
MKDAKFFQTSGGIAEALPALVNVDYHRIRRKMINPLFSAKSMDQLAPIVLQVVKNAIRKATQSHNEIKPLDMQRLYTGVTVRQLCCCRRHDSHH